MDLNSFLDKLVSHAIDIDIGRRGFATDDEEHAGRIHYENGISGSLTSFREAQTVADSQIIILAEMVFPEQELQFCDAGDSITRSSLTQAIESFEGNAGRRVEPGSYLPGASTVTVPN